MALWLVRSEGLSWCTCEQGLASTVGAGQAGCPWCGCGWLFSCALCRKAFAFARAVELNYPLDAARQIDLDGFVRSTFEGDVEAELTPLEQQLVSSYERKTRRMGDISKTLAEGVEYAMLDGGAHPAKKPVRGYKGLYGAHDFDALPQDALRDDKRFWEHPDNPLRAPPYWADAHARLVG